MPPTWSVDEVENREVRMKGEIKGEKRGEDWRRNGGGLEEDWRMVGGASGHFGVTLELHWQGPGH